MSENNKALIRRFYEDVINRGDPMAMEQVVAIDFVDHGARAPGREGLKQFLTMLGNAFPDIRVETQDLLAEADKVAARILVQGTHRGELMGIAAKGKPASWTGMDIFRIAQGRIVERWSVRDLLGLMQQLGGAVPS